MGVKILLPYGVKLKISLLRKNIEVNKISYNPKDDVFKRDLIH